MLNNLISTVVESFHFGLGLQGGFSSNMYLKFSIKICKYLLVFEKNTLWFYIGFEPLRSWCLGRPTPTIMPLRELQGYNLLKPKFFSVKSKDKKPKVITTPAFYKIVKKKTMLIQQSYKVVLLKITTALLIDNVLC